MDRIDSYRVFARVVECKSFTRAAGILRIPRSTVSTVIGQLEARLDTRLLHRTTRRVATTADGDAFYERCMRLLDDFEETETLFRHDASRIRGKLRISVPGRIASRVIAPALPEFFSQYPEIELDMGVTDRMVDLVEGGIDGAVRVGAVPESGLIVRDIGKLALCNCASPAYLEHYGMPVSVGDLDRHLAVGYLAPATTRPEQWEHVEEGETRKLSMRSRVTVDNAEACIACCLAGLGLIQVPAYDVGDYLASGALVEVMPDCRPEPMPIAVVYPYRRTVSRRLQAFIHWVTALFETRIPGIGRGGHEPC